MNKAYERINWQNKPSTATPLSATNLNKMDLALDTIDDRVIDLDTNKQDKSIVKAGNPITFNITDGGVFDKAEVEFSPIQDLHGYDNPWVGGSGKNLWDTTSYLDSVTIGNLVITKIRENVYSLVGSVSSFTYINLVESSNCPVNLASGTYTISIRDASTGDFVSSSTLPFYYNDESTLLSGYYTVTDTALTKIRLLARADVTYNLVIQLQIEEGNQVTSFEPYENICPITGYTELNIFQSNGSTTTPDETYTQSLGGTYYGGTYDYTTGKLTIDRAIVDLGSLTWESAATSVTGKNRFQTAANVISSKNPTDNSQVANIKCSDYVAVSANNVGVATQGIAITTTGRLTIFDDTKSNYTGADFKTAMSGVQLVYELATPTETTLTPTQISALIGDNVMWTDGDKVTVRISTLIDSEYITYDNTSSGLTATNVQDAIDELKALISALGS